MALLPSQIDDFVALTQNEMRRTSWTDLSMEYQEYISSTLIDEKKVVEQGGGMIEFKLKTRNVGNAINTGLFGEDNTKVEDVTKTVKVPWAKQVTSWAYDIDEDLFQSDRETIIRILVMRDHEAMSDMAELNEENLWSKPIDTEDARPLGIPYWLVKDATTTAEGGFNGGNPDGHAAGCGGVDSTKYPRWRNWTFGYKGVSTDDLVRKLKKAVAFTNFVAPVPHPELAFGKSDYQIYTTYRVQEQMERLAETRNDNLGRDLAKYMNVVTVAGIPVKYVPYLEMNDTSDPLYGINWRTFRPFVKRGANMRRNPPEKAPKQHTVRNCFVDNWMNYICYNRRLNFVGSKAA